MAHKMVRQPSETPNINNIDDIVPFRYAYGNQDGYVIGKGQELEATNLGNSIRINSGRVVLQGVEDDIDANGVTFTIDNIGTTRYFVIYYRVNLGTNTTSYEITYDTAGYPTIDAGDDLTKNSSGIANLPLYRFTASSGVISGVEKIVKAIEYINKDVTVKNAETAETAKTINDLKMESGSRGIIILDDDFIIPYREILWKPTEKYLEINEFGIIGLLHPVREGNIIEIKMAFGADETATPVSYKFILNSSKNILSYQTVAINWGDTSPVGEYLKNTYSAEITPSGSSGYSFSGLQFLCNHVREYKDGVGSYGLGKIFLYEITRITE